MTDRSYKVIKQGSHVAVGQTKPLAANFRPAGGSYRVVGANPMSARSTEVVSGSKRGQSSSNRPSRPSTPLPAKTTT